MQKGPLRGLFGGVECTGFHTGAQALDAQTFHFSSSFSGDRLS